MNRKTAAVLVSAGLTAGCAHFAPPAQSLAVRTEGLDTPQVSVSEITPGQAIHRVLRNSAGNVLFAYDLDVAKQGGAYRFLLQPASAGPTFAAPREVNVTSGNEAVRVELMAQPGTSNKIVDVFSLSNSPDVPESTGFGDHLMAMHNRLWKWVHGQ
jgi:hypothetical protein